ncbi:MAG TPA: hypothetical protein VKP08_10265, partial [Anaerolineales bacterium]|nr:hypothetical protein [Anaerolineales bacterium]
ADPQHCYVPRLATRRGALNKKDAAFEVSVQSIKVLSSHTFCIMIGVPDARASRILQILEYYEIHTSRSQTV